MSLAAVIHISEFNECPKNAVQTVLQGKGRFIELHIIDPAYVQGAELYEGWEADQRELEEAGILVSVEDGLDAEKIKAYYIVEIPPHCFMTLSGIEQIQQRVNACDKYETRFGLRTIVYLKDFSVWYGYFLVMAFISLFWYGKPYESSDVRATSIVRNGKKKYIPRHDPQTKVMTPKNANVAYLDFSDDSVSAIRWAIRTNENYNLVWWAFGRIPLIRMWFCMYWFLWVVTFFSTTQFIQMALYAVGQTPVERYSPWSVTTVVLACFWMMSALATVYASTRRYRFQGQLAMIAAMPLYILTFPLVWAYSKLYFR